jgi:hypothetical protein
VVVRNAISQALELKYGGNWPWDAGFERTLSKWHKGELQLARKAIPFRNRIAHHEPIFAYPLAQHQARIKRLIKLRCWQTEQWLARWEVVTATLAARP